MDWNTMVLIEAPCMVEQIPGTLPFPSPLWNADQVRKMMFGARLAALEEAARVCDEIDMVADGYVCEACAPAIRALTAKEPL